MDQSKAFKYFKEAADQGVAEAQYYVGLYCQNGYGNVPKNKDEAIIWFKKAAKGGNKSAKTRLSEDFGIVL